MEKNVVEREDEEIITETEESTEEIIDSLPTGRELTAEDTYPLTATEKSRFFVIIGATGSGKTTLVTAIYHTFLKGNSKERYLFAGSKTLAAFESRSYYVRTASMRTNVEMRRTPRGSIDSVLHLRLKECRTGSINNLLFSDFSGEDYSAVSANVVAAKEDFQIVKAARQIVVLLDGEKMITRQRLSELQSAIHILKTFLDGDIIRRDAQVIIAVSKYDLVSSRGDKLLDRFINSIISRVEEPIPELKGRCVLHFIASMPNDSTNIGVGYGIDGLLDMLLLDPQYDDISVTNRDGLSSQFNLWKERMI